MVVYVCIICKKNFNKKYLYVKHINKVKKCTANKNNENNEIINKFKCKECNTFYNRLDALKKHYTTKKHIMNKVVRKKNTGNVMKKCKVGNDVNINNSKNINNHKNINNNKNINNINNYYISPFDREETNKLRVIEKIPTLLSLENPITEIRLILNLNPDKPKYYNIGYTDFKSGYGILFNGKTWQRKEINVIINELPAFEKNDSFKIKLEINQFIPDKRRKIIEEKLRKDSPSSVEETLLLMRDVNDNDEPRSEQHVKSKDKTATNFFNGRSLIQDAVVKSNAPIEGVNNNNDNSWMDQYDFEEIQKNIDLVKAKKETAKYMAKQFGYIDYGTIVKIIDGALNIEEINIIERLLTRSLVKKINIDREMINKEIEKEKYLNKIILRKI